MSDSFNITLPRIFSSTQILKRLKRSPLEILHRVEEGKIFKLIPYENQNLLCEIAFQNNECIDVRLLNEKLTQEKKTILKRYIIGWFDLDRDLQPFYEVARSDNLLSLVLDNCRGLRIIAVEDLFEALSWAILGQQINLSFAYTLKKRLIENFGQQFIYNGIPFWRFPAPEAIVRANPQQLLDLSISIRKTEYLQEVSRQITEGKLSKELLSQLNSIHQIEKALTGIRGIGAWTANYVLLRCLRHPQAFPVGDAGLQNAVKKLLNMDRKPTETELRELAIPWKGWEAYATFYLWNG